MSGDNKVKRLTEGALLTAVSIVLFLGAFIPLIGILVAPFCPVPLCILTGRYGVRYGCFMAMVTILIVSLLFSVVLGAAFIPFVFTGLLLGSLARYKDRPLKAYVLGILALQLMFLTAFYGYNHIASQERDLLTVNQIIDKHFDNFETSLHGTNQLLKSLAGTGEKEAPSDTKSRDRSSGLLSMMVSKENAAALLNLYEPLLVKIKTPLVQARIFLKGLFYFPFALFFVIAATGFSLSFFVAESLSRRFRFPLPHLPPFSMWQGDKMVAVAAIASVVLTALSIYGSGRIRVWYLHCINFSFVFLLYYVVLGFSLLSFWMGQYRIGPVIRFLIVLLAFRYMAFGPWPLLPLAALTDSFVNLRKYAPVAVDKSDTCEADSNDEKT